LLQQYTSFTVYTLGHTRAQTHRFIIIYACPQVGYMPANF